MINLEQALIAMRYKITGGGKFCWNCYGNNSRYIESDNIMDVVFDADSQVIYEITLYLNKHPLKYINNNFFDAYYSEAKSRNVDPEEYSDGEYFYMISEEDMIRVLKEFNESKDYEYDGDILVSFELDEKTMELAKHAASLRNITIPELVKEAIVEAMKEQSKSI